MLYSSKIYFICPDNNNPVGGVKVIYRHVDILNKYGIPASVLHLKTGFRCTWFLNNTSIVYFRNLKFTESDIIVFPETTYTYFTDKYKFNRPYLAFKRLFSKPKMKYYIHELSTLPNRKVIFNQNAYYTFADFEFESHWDWNFKGQNIQALVCVSGDNKNYLQKAFADVPTYRIHLDVNQPFEYSTRKKPQIAFLVNKSKCDVDQVITMLRLRKSLDGFELIPVRNKTEKEVSDIFKESLIMLHFGATEGFGLPPAEAMLCGSIAIGYHGCGGREFFKPSFSFPIEVGDIMGFVDCVESVIETYKQNPERLITMGKEASEFISTHYNQLIEEEDVVTTWKAILEL